jgi:hypothetical protein
MKTFHDLKFVNHPAYTDGIASKLFFENGYGVSVVRFDRSYGGEKGLFELAVLEGDHSNSKITYSTPVTDGVLGHLREFDVTEIMKQVQSLPRKKL